MKKLSVIMLALAMTLSMAVVASAANFEPYLGGEFQIIYNGDEALENAPIDTEGSWGTWARFKLMLTGTVEDEETGTWAKIGAKLSTWNVADGLKSDDHHYQPIYEAGIKGLLDGTLDIWYNDHEYENAKRGQIPLWTPMAKFGGDPLFQEAPGGVFAVDYNSGNVTLNFGVDINKAKPTDNAETLEAAKDNDPLLIGAGTIGFDAGQARFAFQSNKGGDMLYLVGGAIELGFGQIDVDYLGESPDEGDGTGVLQAAVSLADLGLKGTLVYDNKYNFGTDGGFGVGVEYTGLGDFVLGARMMTASDEADEGDNMTDFYAGYNFGVFETRVGSYKAGKDGDSVFYAAAHVGMW